jgi:hypothetical protein
MRKGILREYQRLLEDQRKFDLWLKANAILGSILMVGMLAMVLAASNVGGPDAAAAASPRSSNIATSIEISSGLRLLRLNWRKTKSAWHGTPDATT